VREALQGLPCVDAKSVVIDYDAKEARFNVKKGSTCKIEDIKQAVADSHHGQVSEVKKAPKS